MHRKRVGLQVIAKQISFFIFTAFVRTEEEFCGATNVRRGFLKIESRQTKCY